MVQGFKGLGFRIAARVSDSADEGLGVYGLGFTGSGFGVVSGPRVWQVGGPCKYCPAVGAEVSKTFPEESSSCCSSLNG